MDIANQVAEKLLQINAIKLNPQKPFTWASGLRSPIYCDNRLALSHPDIRQLLIDAFVDASASFASFDSIAGVATAGIAHGALLAHALGKPFAYVRPKPKAHGRKNMIEGHIPADSRVLVIEDLISTGGSSLKAVQAIREVPAEVVGVMAIFSYGFEQAKTAFADANCPLHTLSHYEALIQSALKSNYISSSELDSLKAWSADPQGWSKMFEGA
jgi:orotate phosphoribosyltransferase